ncbi:MAG: carboxymuconolactone decarboxylase family protein [Nitrospinota bacterium]
MKNDDIWYELAYTVGTVHGLNSVADGLNVPLDFNDAGTRRPRLPLVDERSAPESVVAIFGEIKAFFEMDRAPNVYRGIARDPGYLKDHWAYVKVALEGRTLDRPTKTILALGASVTAKSDYGIDFFLREAQRLGLSEEGVWEVFHVVEQFNTVNKIAAALALEPDMEAGLTPAG